MRRQGLFNAGPLPYRQDSLAGSRQYRLAGAARSEAPSATKEASCCLRWAERLEGWPDDPIPVVLDGETVGVLAVRELLP